MEEEAKAVLAKSLPRNEAYAAITEEDIIKLFARDDVLQLEAMLRVNSDRPPIDWMLSENGEIPQFALSVGYVVAMRNMLNGLTMRDLISRPVDGDMRYKFFVLCLFFTSDKDLMMNDWTPGTFLCVGNAEARKSNSLISHSERLSLNVVRPFCVLPIHFTDEELLASTGVVYDGLNRSQFRDRYEFCCGLVIKIRTGILRLIKRQLLKREYVNEDEANCDLSRLMYSSMDHFLVDSGLLILKTNWSESSLYMAASELVTKSQNISPTLQKVLFDLPLRKRKLCSINMDEDVELIFDESFLAKVAEYHLKMSRPEGTFDLNVTAANDDGSRTDFLTAEESAARTSFNSSVPYEELSKVPREICPSCGSRRQIYCGHCGGIRMPMASELLPPRIDLPFNILLILHWYALCP
jgi:hypothetical protein